MNDKFKIYLESIEVTKTHMERIEKIFEFYGIASKVKIKDIFVNDYFTKEGERKYESLWLFSANYAMESKLDIPTDSYDLLPLRNQVVYWELKNKDYDFKKATEDSRCHLRFTMTTDIEGTLKGTKENCDHLKDIFLNYIVPNLAM